MADIITIGFPYVDYVLWALIIGGLLVLALWGGNAEERKH